MTLVVRRRRPLVIASVVLLVAVAAGGGAWWALTGESRDLGEALFRLRLERDTLKNANRTLEAERTALSRRAAIAERARQVESEAYTRVEEQLADLQDQVLAMKEEVAFYKGIVSDDRAAPGVRIQRFVVEAEGADQEFRFLLVLTRGIRGDNVATGAVSLAVDGDQDGERVRLDLDSLSPFPAPPLEYSFKHFQRLEGRLRLPPRFVPRRVVVRVDSARQGAKPLRETYQWPSMDS